MRIIVGLVTVLVMSFAVELCGATCDVAIGRIDGIEIDDKKVIEAAPGQIELRRGDESVGVRNGLPLCAHDMVSLSRNARVLLRIGQTAETENQITLYGGTTTELSAADSLFLKIGRFFASLRAPFTAGTSFGSLGARGTTFEVEVSEQEATVLQLEGSIVFTQESPISTGRLTSSRMSKFLLARLAQTDLGFQEKAGTEVSRLTQLKLTRESKPQVQQINDEVCGRAVTTNNRVVVDTRPDLPSRLVTTSAENNSALFDQARVQVICQSNRQAMQDLARVYTAWAQGADAVHAIGISANDAVSITDPMRLNDLGNAHRLAGDLDGAEKVYKSAIERDVNFAFPYNGLGDVYRDRALIAFGQRNPSYAQNLLDQARRYYQKSLSNLVWGKEGGSNRAVAFYNLGDANLLMAILQPDAAEQLLSDATRAFQDALRETPSFPFASVGVARAALVRAQLMRQRRPPQGLGFWQMLRLGGEEARRVQNERRPFLDSAEKQLYDVLDRYPGFSVAAEILGEVIEERGERKAASEQFRHATELDPHNAVAYRWLSRTVRNRSEARLYSKLSNQIESGVVAEVTAGRVEISRPQLPESGEEIDDFAAGQVNLSEIHFRDTTPPVVGTVIFTNTGRAALTVQSVQLDKATGFAIREEDCSRRSLGGGQRCSITVAFTPPREGTYEGVLAIIHTGSNSPQRVRLLGQRLGRQQQHGTVSEGNDKTPAEARGQVNREYIGFRLAKPPQVEAIVFTNVGEAPLTIRSVGFENKIAGFAITEDKCSRHALAAREQCLISVGFFPPREGSYAAVLNIIHMGSNSPQRVRLSGQAIR